jgi:hypothetical protein
LPTLNQTFAAMADEAGGPGVPISERRSLLRAVGLLPLQEILFGRNIGNIKNQNGRSNMQSGSDPGIAAAPLASPVPASATII